jgi:hypothetical protein
MKSDSVGETMALLREMLIQAFILMLLVGSVVGVAVGVGLVARTEATLAFFRRMNRWALSGIEARAREERPTAEASALSPAKRRFAGVSFVIGGVFAVAVLASMPKIPAAALLQARGALWVASFMLADALRWLLIIGCSVGTIVGVLLLFFPNTWMRLERRANRWYSTKRFFAETDVMHTPLDRWIERAPRPAGALIAILSVVSLVAFAGLLILHK